MLHQNLLTTSIRGFVLNCPFMIEIAGCHQWIRSEFAIHSRPLSSGPRPGPRLSSVRSTLRKFRLEAVVNVEHIRPQIFSHLRKSLFETGLFIIDQNGT